MSVWDRPEARPPSAWPREGDSIEATITRIEFVSGHYGPTMQIELDRDGRGRFAPKTLWQTFYQLRPEIGDRVRITRLSEREWRVERLAATVVGSSSAIHTTPPATTSGPSW